jgi:hypothetical protein
MPMTLRNKIGGALGVKVKWLFDEVDGTNEGDSMINDAVFEIG